MKDIKISQLGEKELIKRFLKKRDTLLTASSDNLIYKSYYDDAAVEENTTNYTILSTDMLIQHTHFPTTMTYYQMGEKIVTVNVSDILANNAFCESILISMALPPDMLISQYDELTDGILNKCKEYNVKLIGGDINENDEIILNATTIGKCDDNIKLQEGIKENELIAVTGELGGPAAAFDLITHDVNINIPINEKNNILSTILEPTLPMDLFNKIHKYPDMITSMTDITDGLAVELGHLSDKNPNCGFEIYFDKLPYNKYLEDIAKHNNKEIIDYLLHFGEEFELLLTLNETEYIKHKNELKDLYIIGKTNNNKKISLVKDNKTFKIQPNGFEHLKESK